MVGLEGELTCLSVLLNDKDLWEAYGESVGEAFTHTQVQLLYDVTKACWERFRVLPKEKDMKVLINRMAIDKKWSAVFEQAVTTAFQWAYTKPTAVGRGCLEDFIRESKIRELKAQVHQLRVDSDLDLWESVRAAVENFREISLEEEDWGVHPFDPEMIKNPNKVLEESLGPPIFCGIPAFDERTGGFRREEMMIVVGTTGAGKTICLGQMAINMASMGHKGIYFFNDNLQGELISRVWANQSNIPIDMPREEEYFSERLSHNTVGMNLNLKELAPQTDGVAKIIRYVKKYEAEFGKIDFIVVDYGDLLACTKEYSDRRHEVKNVFDSLHAAAKLLKVFVLTATQSNAGGLKEGTITLANLSEAYAKAWVATHVMSLNWNEQERSLAMQRWAMLKSRRIHNWYSVVMKLDIPRMKAFQDMDYGVMPIVTTKKDRCD